MSRMLAVVATCICAGSAVAGENFKMPPEVTPAMRAACEADVRRLCISSGSTVNQVKSCVLEKFTRLGKRCQVEIASAGLAP